MWLWWTPWGCVRLLSVYRGTRLSLWVLPVNRPATLILADKSCARSWSYADPGRTGWRNSFCTNVDSNDRPLETRWTQWFLLDARLQEWARITEENNQKIYFLFVSGVGSRSLLSLAHSSRRSTADPPGHCVEGIRYMNRLIMVIALSGVRFGLIIRVIVKSHYQLIISITISKDYYQGCDMVIWIQLKFFDWLSQQSDYNCPITCKCPINDLIGGYRPIGFEEIVILMINKDMVW